MRYRALGGAAEDLRAAPAEDLRRALGAAAEDSRRAQGAQEVPEVLRLDLAEVVLTLKAAGVDDLSAFRWFEAPEDRSLARAITLLEQLGALRPDGTLTGEGRRLTRYPLHPRQARVMEAAADQGCIPAMALVVALQQGRPLFVRGTGDPQRKFGTPDDPSDFLPLLRAGRRRKEFPSGCLRPDGPEWPGRRGSRQACPTIDRSGWSAAGFALGTTGS